MGRFAHLLQREVFGFAAVPVLRTDLATRDDPLAWHFPNTQTVVTSSPVVHRIAKEVPMSPFVLLEPGLATQQLLQQMLEPLTDLQVLDDDDYETTSDYETKSEQEIEPEDFYQSALLAGSPPGLKEIDAEVLLPGGRQNHRVPFDLGLFQFHSAYAPERFVQKPGEDTSEDDDVMSDRSSDSSDSVLSATNGHEEHSHAMAMQEDGLANHKDMQPTDVAASTGPRVVKTSPWAKCPAHKERATHLRARPLHLDDPEVDRHSKDNVEQELEEELQYIKVLTNLVILFCKAR